MKIRAWGVFMLAVLILTGCKNQPEKNQQASADRNETQTIKQENRQEDDGLAQLRSDKSTDCLKVLGVLLEGESKEKVLTKLTNSVEEMKRVGKDWTKIEFCGVTFDMSVNWNNLNGKSTVDDMILMSKTMDAESFNKIKDCISERYGSPEINDIKDLKDSFSGHCEWHKECKANLQTVKMDGKDGMLLIFSNN